MEPRSKDDSSEARDSLVPTDLLVSLTHTWMNCAGPGLSGTPTSMVRRRPLSDKICPTNGGVAPVEEIGGFSDAELDVGGGDRLLNSN